jgi:signal transduction histidine kinase
MAAGSAHIEQPEAAGLIRAYLTSAPVLVGLMWSTRRPGSRFGPLLVLFGLSAWLLSLESSDLPLLFTLGVLAEPLFLGVIFYVLLAFPMGRLESRIDKFLIWAYAVGMMAFFGARAMLLDSLRPTAVLSSCTPGCPDNPLNIANLPDSVVLIGTTYFGAAAGFVVTVAVGGLLVWRLRIASRPRRRASVAVVLTALVLLPAVIVYGFFATFPQKDSWASSLIDLIQISALIMFPVGFLVALLQADAFAGRALRRLLEDLSSHPTPARWRDAIARALDDPAVKLAYWDPESEKFREADGATLAPPLAGSGRHWVPITRGPHPVAALSVDEVLIEDPELVQAASRATCLAVENGHLEGELRTSLKRLAAAGDDERRRIARDLHDSAQQRLVTLRIHLSLAGDWLDRPEEQAMIEELGHEVDEALTELRNVTYGFYPPVLSQYGIASALRSASSRAALPVRVEDLGLTRHGDVTEQTVYFCCLEALQNAAKHGGKSVSAVVRLVEEDGELCFEVEDDGVGFLPEIVRWGAGLANLADRLKAVGGTLLIQSAPGKGTRVSGRIALTSSP